MLFRQVSLGQFMLVLTQLFGLLVVRVDTIHNGLSQMFLTQHFQMEFQHSRMESFNIHFLQKEMLLLKLETILRFQS